MTWAVTAAVGGALVGGYFANQAADTQASAAQNAANTSANASNYAADLQYKAFQENAARQKPWLQAGQNALARLSGGLQTGGEFATPFSQTNWQQDPGYAFRLAEGNKLLNQTAAARGGLISGNALKAAERYGQDMGSQEYQNAFNRYYREREAMMNPLQSLAGVGQTSAQSLGGAAQNAATSMGNYGMTNAANQGNALMAGANARSSMYTGFGNVGGQLIGGIGNYLRNYNSTNDLGANANLPYQMNMASDTVYPGSNFTGGTYGPYQQ